MRTRSRFAPSKPPGLMLTSLLDMFTIILIFLIVSFDAESFDFKLHPDVTLAESSARTTLQAAVNVAVTRGRLVVEQTDLLALDDGELRASDHEAGQVPELVEALREEYERRYGEDAIAPEAGEPIVVVQSDRSLDYRTLYVVLRSAAAAGFFKYRLATMKS
ncbi:MAG: biopolymer transporter ExbD [Polyangiales bacterium]